MEICLRDKTIVITGSSRGIGSEMAKAFAKKGANVVINYFQSEQLAKALFKEISQYNNNCLIVQADVTNKSDVIKLYRETTKKYGKVDALINNAGTCKDNLLQMMSEKQWLDVINLNLNGVFYCSKYFSKNMIKNRNGKIINISSLMGQIGNEKQTNYSASKAGIIGFTKALAKELGSFNISVNAICPGFIVTDMVNESREKNQVYLSEEKTIVEKVDYMNEHDYLDALINFVTFMVSDKFHSITGQVFNLDSRL